MLISEIDDYPHRSHLAPKSCPPFRASSMTSSIRRGSSAASHAPTTPSAARSPHSTQSDASSTWPRTSPAASPLDTCHAHALAFDLIDRHQLHPLASLVQPRSHLTLVNFRRFPPTISTPRPESGAALPATSPETTSEMATTSPALHPPDFARS